MKLDPIIDAAQTALFSGREDNPHTMRLRDCLIDVQMGVETNITELATVLEKHQDWQREEAKVKC